MTSKAIKVYIDRNDWWIGVYRGPNHWYVCPLPCVVIRFNRTTRHLCFTGDGYEGIWEHNGNWACKRHSYELMNDGKGA